MLRASQATSERVQRLRAEYWEQVRELDLNNLVFFDEMGVLLGLMRTNAWATPGLRSYVLKPFYRGHKVSVIGAVTVSKVLALMPLDGSINAVTFEVYVENLLVPQLWPGAVGVITKSGVWIKRRKGVSC